MRKRGNLSKGDVLFTPSQLVAHRFETLYQASEKNPLNRPSFRCGLYWPLNFLMNRAPPEFALLVGCLIPQPDGTLSDDQTLRFCEIEVGNPPCPISAFRIEVLRVQQA